MKVQDIKKLLKNKEDDADCFCYNPNTGDSFEIDQVNETADGDGNTEFVFTCFEDKDTKQKHIDAILETIQKVMEHHGVRKYVCINYQMGGYSQIERDLAEAIYDKRFQM